MLSDLKLTMAISNDQLTTDRPLIPVVTVMITSLVNIHTDWLIANFVREHIVYILSVF